MKIDYNRGGYFALKNVKWDAEGQMFLDYQILIENIEDEI